MDYAFLADLVIVIHAAYVGFVVLGQIAILLGAALKWGWVRNLWFRLVHLAAIGYVGLESFLHFDCPLTVWERQLRHLAGQPITEEGFVARCVNGLLMNSSFDPWVYDYLHIGFALLVLVTFMLVPPRLRWRSPLTAQGRTGSGGYFM